MHPGCPGSAIKLELFGYMWTTCIRILKLNFTFFPNANNAASTSPEVMAIPVIRAANEPCVRSDGCFAFGVSRAVASHRCPCELERGGIL
jgi:hypothetical protein